MIIITGFEMPNNCSFCPLNYDMVGCSASDNVKFDYAKIDHQRNENCPLKNISCKTCKHRPYYVADTRKRSLDIFYPDTVCPYICDDHYYTDARQIMVFCDKWEAKDEKIPGNGEN